MRRVTILDRIADDVDSLTLRVVFWIAVPAGREALYANPAYVSKLPADVAASGAELTVLRNGQATEVEDHVVVPKKDASGNLYTTAQLQANIADQLTARYQALSAQVASFNPRLLYGTVYSDENG